ncbi:RTA1-domain-containing protein [Mycena epipterygia]|nr:RTA1-domain-containing protein [Mycena epipterygia]
MFNITTSTDIPHSHYGYIPVVITFLVLFGLSTALHLGQAPYFRMWWFLPTTCLCGIGELVGWTGQLWSSFNAALDDLYMMQITTTIISPTPLIAVSFILLGRSVERLGTPYSQITPKSYSRIFVSCDVVALVVQGLGGGLAASANDDAGAAVGAHIMLGGIIFQFVAIIASTACAADVPHRYTTDRQAIHEPAPVREMSLTIDPRVKLMIYALAFSTAALFIRSIYHIIELSKGWHGPVIQTQVYFNVLDGAMIVLAIFTLNIAHPGLLFGSHRPSPVRYEGSENQSLV